ncbi:hypothetical protein Ahy_A01g002254 [Arachis hypogaea]|uniref:NADH:quinone oxidoreductase/Mrp antiporter transmembrane domain-containing protein n=1 Tax=Arachis hypogaea TaxID=3818 RepID=A0A445EQD7_ARAHY|nr:hypothetical protein Ahy_A01g002254 [Arachis hypogaea]
MEGPTPISALIHAATMVAAGIFLVARLLPLFIAIPTIMNGIAFIGIITLFLGATLAIAQKDIKRNLAYSTMSQLGYMMLALVLNWDRDKKSSSIEESRASFVEVNINGLIGDFLRIDPTKSQISYIRKRNDPSGSEWISDNESDQININPFFPISFQKKNLQEYTSNLREVEAQ